MTNAISDSAFPTQGWHEWPVAFTSFCTLESHLCAEVLSTWHQVLLTSWGRCREGPCPFPGSCILQRGQRINMKKMKAFQTLINM